MKIEVEKILEVRGSVASGRGCVVDLEVEVTDYQMEKMVYELWNILESDRLNEIFKKEGYSLIMSHVPTVPAKLSMSKAVAEISEVLGGIDSTDFLQSIYDRVCAPGSEIVEDD